jgi:hypothetical protein
MVTKNGAHVSYLRRQIGICSTPSFRRSVVRRGGGEWKALDEVRVYTAAASLTSCVQAGPLAAVEYRRYYIYMELLGSTHSTQWLNLVLITRRLVSQYRLVRPRPEGRPSVGRSTCASVPRM